MAHAADAQRGYKCSDEKRRAILNAARDIIEDKGLSHMSAKMIAQRAHISRGTLYYYYEDKNALVDAIIDDYIEDLAEALAIWEETRPKASTAPRSEARSS